MNCFKLLGEKVMASTFERQVTELHIRASILNQFTALGTPQTVAAGYLFGIGDVLVYGRFMQQSLSRG
jgi:uncharacterized membrane protein YedE/YeeE